MILANRKTFASSKELSEHQKTYKSKYEKVEQTGDVYIRYWSNEPATRYGDFILSKLPEIIDGDVPDTLVYLERLEFNVWFVCVIENNQIVDQLQGAIDVIIKEFDYDIHQSEHVYVNEPIKNISRKTISVNTPEKTDLFNYQIAKKKVNTLKLIGGFVALCIIFAVVFFGVFKSSGINKVPQKQALSPLEKFYQSYRQFTRRGNT